MVAKCRNINIPQYRIVLLCEKVQRTTVVLRHYIPSLTTYDKFIISSSLVCCDNWKWLDTGSVRHMRAARIRFINQIPHGHRQVPSYGVPLSSKPTIDTPRSRQAGLFESRTFLPNLPQVIHQTSSILTKLKSIFFLFLLFVSIPGGERLLTLDCTHNLLPHLCTQTPQNDHIRCKFAHDCQLHS